MKLGSGIRVALVAAMLLAQLGLPGVHVLAFAGEGQDFAAVQSPTLAPASSAVSQEPAHDPSACPICLASGHARNGIGRAPLDALRTRVLAAIPWPRELRIALPREPELVSALPRAPPILALIFA
jgi:hypothetical protein